MSSQSALACTLAALLLLSLAWRYNAAEPAYDLALREDDRRGRFLFYVYPLSSGGYGYTARLVNLPFPFRDRSETGVLAQADWERLKTFRRLARLPGRSLSPLVRPGQLWGSLERTGAIVTLRYADFWALNKDNLVSEVHTRLILKSRRFL